MAYTRKFKKGDVIKSRIDGEIDQVTRIVLDKKKSSYTYGQVVYILSQQDDLWPCEYIDNTYEKIEPKSKSKQPTKAKSKGGRKSRRNKRKKTFNKSYKR
jgi:hypothetical protein